MGSHCLIPRNWVDLITAVGVVGGLFFTAIALYSETKTRRISNLLTITKNHRELWTEFAHNPQLSRVLRQPVDLTKHPITREEEIFVIEVFSHICTAYYATKENRLIKLEGLRRDVWSFVSLPLPNTVWEKIKVIQNDEFVTFVESCRNWK